MKTGRPSEGVLVSADDIVKKSIAGFGVFSVDAILSIVGLSENVRPATISQRSLDELGLVYIIAIYAFARRVQATTKRATNATSTCCGVALKAEPHEQHYDRSAIFPIKPRIPAETSAGASNGMKCPTFRSSV